MNDDVLSALDGTFRAGQWVRVSLPGSMIHGVRARVVGLGEHTVQVDLCGELRRMMPGWLTPIVEDE